MNHHSPAEIENWTIESATDGLYGSGKNQGAIVAISGYEVGDLSNLDSPLEEVARKPWNSISYSEIVDLTSSIHSDDEYAWKLKDIVLGRRRDFFNFLRTPSGLLQEWTRKAILFTAGIWIPSHTRPSDTGPAYEAAQLIQDTLFDRRFVRIQGAGNLSVNESDPSRLELTYLYLAPMYMSLTLLHEHPEDYLNTLLASAETIREISPCTIWRLAELVVRSGVKNTRIIHRAIRALETRRDTEAVRIFRDFLALRQKQNQEYAFAPMRSLEVEGVARDSNQSALSFLSADLRVGVSER